MMAPKQQWRHNEHTRHHCDAPVDDERPPDSDSDDDEDISGASPFNAKTAPLIVFDFAARQPQRRRRSDAGLQVDGTSNESSKRVIPAVPLPRQQGKAKRRASTNSIMSSLNSANDEVMPPPAESKNKSTVDLLQETLGIQKQRRANSSSSDSLDSLAASTTAAAEMEPPSLQHNTNKATDSVPDISSDDQATPAKAPARKNKMKRRGSATSSAIMASLSSSISNIGSAVASQRMKRRVSNDDNAGDDDIPKSRSTRVSKRRGSNDTADDNDTPQVVRVRAKRRASISSMPSSPMPCLAVDVDDHQHMHPLSGSSRMKRRGSTSSVAAYVPDADTDQQTMQSRSSASNSRMKRRGSTSSITSSSVPADDRYTTMHSRSGNKMKRRGSTSSMASSVICTIEDDQQNRRSSVGSKMKRRGSTNSMISSINCRIDDNQQSQRSSVGSKVKRRGSTNSMASSVTRGIDDDEETNKQKQPSSHKGKRRGSTSSMLSFSSVASIVLETTRVSNKAKRRASASFALSSSSNHSFADMSETTRGSMDDSMSNSFHTENQYMVELVESPPPATKKRMSRRGSSSNLTMDLLQKLGAHEEEDPLAEAIAEQQQREERQPNNSYSAQALFPARHRVVERSNSIDQDDEEGFLDGLVFMAPNSEDSVRNMMGHLGRRYSMPRRASIN